jgi:hypothetical protein
VDVKEIFPKIREKGRAFSIQGTGKWRDLRLKKLGPNKCGHFLCGQHRRVAIYRTKHKVDKEKGYK